MTNYLLDRGVSELGMTIRIWVPDTCSVPDPTDMGMETIFYPRVVPVPDLNQDGYGTGIFFTRG
jgi:hypothetical protein